MGHSQQLRLIQKVRILSFARVVQGNWEKMGTEVLRLRRDASTGYLPPRLMVQSRKQSPQFLPEIPLPSEKAALPGSDVAPFLELWEPTNPFESHVERRVEAGQVVKVKLSNRSLTSAVIL
jgi:hypothetical protein